MTWIWPTTVCFTATAPVDEMDTSSRFVPAGRLTGGHTRSPSPVTSWPLASEWKSPERVSARLPSPRFTWKNPGPSSATESGSLLCWRPPWLKTRPASTIAEPAPIRMPASML